MRSYEYQDDAEQAALGLYRRHPEIPKIIVCRIENHRRVVTIYGDRSNPTVNRRPDESE